MISMGVRRRDKFSLGIELGKAYLERVDDDVQGSSMTGHPSFLDLSGRRFSHELIVGKRVLGGKDLLLLFGHIG